MSNQYMHQLHGLRALAALGVLIFHWGALFGIHPQLHEHGGIYSIWWWISFFIGSGWVGVMVFFVLSGTVLSTPYLSGKSPVLSTFYLRRLLRIYPAVWLQLSVMMVGSFWILGLPAWQWGTDLIANLLLWIHLPPGHVKPLNGVWWTLPVELGFYLCFPLILLLFRRIGAVGLLLLAALICISWRLGAFYYFNADSYAPYQVYLDALPSSIFYFCTGILVAHAAQPERSRAYQSTLLGLALIIALLFYLVVVLDKYWAGHWLLLFWPLLCAPGIALLVYALRQPLAGYQWLARQPFKWMGDTSFGIYLWHFPVMLVVHRYFYSADGSLAQNVQWLLLSMVLTFALAGLSFKYVEAPLIQWGRRRFVG